MNCLSTIDKVNNQFNKLNVEGINKIQKSFNRRVDKILNNKKLKWIYKDIEMDKLEVQTKRRINRYINNHNIVEGFENDNIFEEIKCIKINEPNDINGFYQFISTRDIPQDQPKFTNKNERIEDAKLREPIEEFIFKCESEIQIKKDLKEFLKHIYFPSKVLIRFQGVVETQTDDDKYEYYDLKVKNGRYTTTSIIKNVNDIKTFVNNNIHNGINTSINNFIQTNSKSKLCVIYGLVLSVYPLGSIGEFIPEISLKFGSMIKKLRIYNCGDNLCFFAAYVYYLIDIGMLKVKNPSPLNYQFRSYLKKVFNDFYYGLDFNNYKGINEEDILKFCDKYDLKIVVYNFNENVKYNRTYGEGHNVYSVVEEILTSTTSGITSGSSHFMYCPDINKLSELVFCPKCFIRSYKNNDNGRYKLKQHILKCNGEIKPKLKVLDYEKPYCEVFYNNDLFRYSFIHKFNYTPIKYYITYDFETLSDKIENQKLSTEQMIITSSAEPFSVAYYTNLNDESGYYCLYNLNNGKLDINNDFIEQFIDYIVKVLSPKIKEANKQNFIKNMGDDYDKFKDDEYFNKYLNKYCSNVSVFGWNSSNFDTSFLKQHLSKYPEIQFIGSTTSAKQIKIQIINKDEFTDGNTQTNNSYSVAFKDGLLYVSKCSLDEASRTFGKSKDRVKGIFPYSLLNSSNIKDNLLRTKPFDKKDFFNTLKQQELTDEEYEKYISDFKNYKNFYEYTKFYNVKDCEIMIPIMDNLIKMYWKMNIDLCQNISLASCAAQMKYLSCYKDFDINKNYSLRSQKYQIKEDNNDLDFKLSREKFNKMCENYKIQDEIAHRETKNNITVNDYDYFNDLLLKNNLCPMCYRRFTNKNKPTLDRNDNSKPHTKENVKWMCRYCNCYKSNHNELETKFFIQLRNYAEYMNLPFTINDKNTLNILRSGITGGLSNVQNRDGRRGNNICKLKYTNGKVEIIDTNNKITHFSSIDFNSLYPSSYSSQYNELIPYTNHKMCMPGKLINKIKVETEKQFKYCLDIINKKQDLFVAVIKGQIPEDNLNKCINYLPLFRNVKVENKPEIIGDYMYEYMKKINYINIDKSEIKLTQTFTTEHCSVNKPCDEVPDGYTVISSYYLWFLIDTFDFKIEDIKYLLIFSKHDKFNYFVNECMKNRCKAILECGKDSAEELSYKIFMNSSYGFDSLDSSRFKKCQLVDKKKAFEANRNIFHISTQKLNDNSYLLINESKSYSLNTPFQSALFTLDNAKYWYLNFIYNFMFKAFDTNKILSIEGDTDSKYFAISGNPNEGYKQGIKYIIKDKKFYSENVFKYLTSDYYLPDEYEHLRPKFDSKLNKMLFDKKILGCAIEKDGENIIALGSKCYTTFNDDGTTKSLKLKGVNKSTNKHIKYNNYENIIDDKENLISGKNYLLSFRKFESKPEITEIKNKLINQTFTTNIEYYKYVYIELNKTALTGLFNKMKVIKNSSCQICVPLYLN